MFKISSLILFTDGIAASFPPSSSMPSLTEYPLLIISQGPMNPKAAPLILFINLSHYITLLKHLLTWLYLPKQDQPYQYHSKSGWRFSCKHSALPYLSCTVQTPTVHLKAIIWKLEKTLTYAQQGEWSHKDVYKPAKNHEVS